jgi:plastocyanin
VKSEHHSTPAHRLLLCAGVLFCALLSGCEKGALVGDQKDRTLELLGDTIDLPAGVDLHDVLVRTGAQYKDFDPPQVQAKPGDYLRFTTGDSRTHAIVFEVTDPQLRSFLESKTQLRSPPLVSKGTSWVVALQDAPAGTYGFRCLVHNDRGQLIVDAGGR